MNEGARPEEFGPYIVYEKLGVGGMAQVHRAIAADAKFSRPVALKRLLSHVADSEEMVRSFVREAQLASYLRHENIAETYDLGRVGNIYFIVMELITGRNLREVLQHCGATTGPMPVQIALNILNQICDALDYAHNLRDETGQPLGIIHRDVSPSNVIVSDTGVVKLIDFGIAKVSRRGMQTMGDTLKGKFAYMAPEYIDGRIDTRADLFAVGVIAHELLTNRPLFSGRDDIDTLNRVRDMHIDPPSKKNPLVPPDIDDVVMTALARDPDHRWQHATALRTALTTLTRRLRLVASNAQVVQWLDWAFSHARKQRDRTEAAGGSISGREDPSISIEPRSVHLPAMSQQITLIKHTPVLEPPTHPPLGTPASIPAQRSARSVASSGSVRASRAAAPPDAAPGLPAAPELPAHRIPGPPSPAAPSIPPAPGPMLAAPRPSPRSLPAAVPHDPVPSATMPHELAPPPAAPSATATTPARRSRVLAVVLLVLAAAIAAITVYFVLPLLT